MGNKEKRCDGCLKDRVIWKNYLDEDGVRRRYCKLCAGVLMKVRKKPKPTVRKTLRTRSLKRQKQEKVNDETFWKATDRACHQWVHAHPKEARELGFLI